VPQSYNFAGAPLAVESSAVMAFIVSGGVTSV
jgi:hypothetical protein